MPEKVVVHFAVVVRDDVAQALGLTDGHVWTALLQLLGQLARGLADDLQLALSGAAHQPTGVEGLPAGLNNLGELASGVQDVLDEVLVA